MNCGSDRVEPLADERNRRDLEAADQELRQQRDQRQVDRADQRDPRQDRVDVLRRPLAGPDARDEAAVLPHVLRDVIRVEDDRRVEVREEDDADDVEQVVERHARSRAGRSTALHDHARREHRRDRRRERQDRRGEDHRDDAAGVHLQRDVRARPAVHPPPDDALGVLHGDPPVAALDEDDRADHQRPSAPAGTAPGSARSGRSASARTSCSTARGRPTTMPAKMMQRHAVADAALGDLLAEPHDEQVPVVSVSTVISRKPQPGL